MVEEPSAPLVMSFERKLIEVQQLLKEHAIDGWLLYDYRGSNPLACTFLELPAGIILSRRFFYWIPQRGEPVKIVSSIEPHTLDHLPGTILLYRTWEELESVLESILDGQATIAMEYSPYNALPSVSKVDAGTLELVKRNGLQVVSSASMLQKYTSVWTPEQFQLHLKAADLLSHIIDKTWRFIAKAIQAHDSLTEYQVQQFMLHEIHAHGFVTDHSPICAVNAHSADPHYEPHEKHSSFIQRGDFILLDVWCKKDVPHAVYADIARVGVLADKPTALQQKIFDIVKEARDKATEKIRIAYENKRPIQGWEVDQCCRDIIEQSGYGDFFIHRTGHSIGGQVHGSGANLDNYETHDFRELLSGTCVSVEPGIYLPEQFGIRLEYDVYLDPIGKLIITGGIQQEITCLESM